LSAEPELIVPGRFARSAADEDGCGAY
jgi:hypothetical protein